SRRSCRASGAGRTRASPRARADGTGRAPRACGTPRRPEFGHRARSSRPIRAAARWPRDRRSRPASRRRPSGRAQCPRGPPGQSRNARGRHLDGGYLSGMEKTFGIRYLEIAGGIWVVACAVVWLLVAVASPTWEDALAFTFGWAVCLGALWWTLDTVRTYQ